MACLLLYMSVTINGQIILDSPTSDPYLDCLKIFIQSLKELKQNKSGDTIYVGQRDYLSDFTGTYNGVIVKMITGDFLFEKTKGGQTLSVINIFPLEFNDSVATIHICDTGFSRKRKRYNSICNYFNKIKVEYDCEEGKYNYEIVDSH